MHTYEVTEARVDWITATATIPHSPNALFDVGANLLRRESEAGNAGRPSNFEGYRGTATRHAFVGFRIDGACVRCGGDVARDCWGDVARAARRVTRLDLAVTVQTKPSEPNVARDYWNALGGRDIGVGRPTDYTLIQSVLGGQTLYCGSRASEIFGRIYDKGKESRGRWPDGSWRYEVEYKARAAATVAEWLPADDDQPRHILSVVRRRFADWGCPLPVPDALAGWRPPPSPSETDMESRFKWFETQVSASVEKLSTAYTADEMRRALGLQFEADKPPLGPEDRRKRSRPVPTLLEIDAWQKRGRGVNGG